MALTAKQQRFVDEYLIDLNATQAAIRAGYAKGSATVEGARLLANAKVGAVVDEAKAKRAAELAIDARWVLKRLAMEVEADLAELYAENGSLRPVAEWPLIWRQGLVAGVETVREGKGDDEASFVDKLKLSDRTRRLELIGKHVDIQAFKDRVEHSADEGLAAALAAGNARVGD